MSTPNQRPGDEGLRDILMAFRYAIQANHKPIGVKELIKATDDAIAAIKHRETEAEERGLVKGIKLVDEALLDDVTGTYPVQMVRTLIKLLVWENTPPDKRSNSSQPKN